jgi:hypothetical protein
MNSPCKQWPNRDVYTPCLPNSCCILKDYFQINSTLSFMIRVSIVLPIASEAFLMKLLVLINTIDRVWRYGSNALGANVLATRRMRSRRSTCVRVVISVLGKHGTLVAYIGDSSTVKTNETIWCFMKLSALRNHTVALNCIIMFTRRNSFSSRMFWKHTIWCIWSNLYESACPGRCYTLHRQLWRCCIGSTWAHGIDDSVGIETHHPVLCRSPGRLETGRRSCTQSTCCDSTRSCTKTFARRDRNCDRTFCNEYSVGSSFLQGEIW